MIKKITAVAVRGFLCLKNFNKETVKRIAEDAITDQIARHQEPPVLQEKIAKGRAERIRAFNLGLRAEIAFAQIKLEQFNKTRCLVIILLCCLASLQVLAQPAVKQITPLQIGSKLPESFWLQQHLVYAKGKTVAQNLSQYKNKLLILDFWATWCSSCTKKFKYIDSLQKEYEGLAVVLLVDSKSTRDTPEKIAKTMARFNDQLTTIVADSLLSGQFIHTSVPHYIWIAGGHFLAASGSEFMHKGNLDAILDRQQALKEANKPK